MADFTIPNSTPVFNLECKAAFDALEEKEKKYAHFLSQADYEGGLIVLVQTSPESVPIFLLFQRLFSEQDIESLKKCAQSADKRITDEDFQVCSRIMFLFLLGLKVCHVIHQKFPITQVACADGKAFNQ